MSYSRPKNEEMQVEAGKSVLSFVNKMVEQHYDGTLSSELDDVYFPSLAQFDCYMPKHMVFDGTLKDERYIKEDSQSILWYYLYVASFVMMHTFSNRDEDPKLEALFKKASDNMEDAIRGYRVAVQMDNYFIDCTKQAGLYDIVSWLEGKDSTQLFCPETIGIFCSERKKDLNFAFKTLRTFLTTMVPGFKTRTGSAHFIDEHLAQAIIAGTCKLGDNQIDIVGAGRKASAVTASVRSGGEAVAMHMIVACLGAEESAMAVLQLFNGPVEMICVDKLMNLFIEAEISLSDHSFFPGSSGLLVCQAYLYRCFMSAKKAEEDSHPLDGLGPYAEELYHAFGKNFLLKNEVANHGLKCKVEELEQEVQRLNEALDAASHAEPVIVEDHSEELSAARKRIAELEQKVDDSKSRNKALEEENAVLTKTVAKVKATYNELNNQLIDVYSEMDNFLDEEDDDDSPASATGLAGRIGQETVELLRDKRVLVVGGHASTHRKLMDLFPNWECYHSYLSASKGAPRKLDAVVCMVSYCGHQTYNVAKGMAESSNIRFICVRSTSAVTAALEIAKHFF